MKIWLYIRLALSFVVLDTLFWAVSRHRFFDANPLIINFAIAFFSKFLILLRTRICWRELAGLFMLLILLCGLAVFFFGHSLIWPLVVCILGFDTLGVMAMRVIWLEGDERRTAVFTLLPCIVLLAIGWKIVAMLEWTGKRQPQVLDLNLFSFDASLHVQFPFLVGQLFHRYVPLLIVAVLVYAGLPILLGLIYAGCLMSDRKNALACFIALVIAGPIGVIFYNIFPAAGPAYLFGGNFPWHPLSIEQSRHLLVQPIAIAGFRNAMPSLHAAWAYIAFWFSRNLSRWERGLAGFFLIFTLLATLGTGEHYVIDLVVALPFALFILALSKWFVTGNWRMFAPPLAAGLLTTFLWLGALRSAMDVFWLSPVVPWAACLITALGTLWAAQRFLRSQAEGESREMPLQQIPERVGG